MTDQISDDYLAYMFLAPEFGGQARGGVLLPLDADREDIEAQRLIDDLLLTRSRLQALNAASDQQLAYLEECLARRQ